MKKIFYILFPLLAAAAWISCDDETDIPDVSGSWEYASPHFVFEYAQDTVVVPMPPRPVKIAAKDVTPMFKALADEKMKQYFKGLDFGNDHQLTIDMQMGEGPSASLHARYKQSGSFLQVELDSNELKALTQGAVSQIPAISFGYVPEQDHLQIYLGKSYLDVMYAMMADQLVDILISRVMHQNPAQFPEPAKKAMKAQFDALFGQIRQLEIGFCLNRAGSSPS